MSNGLMGGGVARAILLVGVLLVTFLVAGVLAFGYLSSNDQSARSALVAGFGTLVGAIVYLVHNLTNGASNGGTKSGT